MSKLFGDDYNGRKAVPIFEGGLMYFPKALAALAAVSEAGNHQHNPGEPLHWARGKSMDQYNTALRHMMDHRMGGGRLDPQQEGQEINNGWKMERFDKDGVRHLAKALWRIAAALELDIEEEEKGPQPAVSAGPESQGQSAEDRIGEDGAWKPGAVTAQERPQTVFCACGQEAFSIHPNDLLPTVIKNGETHSCVVCTDKTGTRLRIGSRTLS